MFSRLACIGLAGVLYKCFAHESKVLANDKEGEVEMNRRKRVLIVGGGIVGLSVAHSLIAANNGDVSVKLIDAGIPVYSSVGESRNTEVVQKNQLYLDMAVQSHRKWRQLDYQSSKKIFYEIPLLEIGENDGWNHYIQLLTTNKIPFEILDSNEMSNRYPTLNFDPLNKNQNGFLSNAGIIHAENVLKTLQSICVSSSNFQILNNKSIVRIDSERHVAIDGEGSEHIYDKLVLCAGPWTNMVLRSGGLRTFPLLVVCMRRSYFGLLHHLKDPEWFDIGSARIPSLRIKESFAIGSYNWFSLTPHLPGGETGCKCGVTVTPEIVGNEEFELDSLWHKRMYAQFKKYKFLEEFKLYPDPQECSLSQILIKKFVRGIDHDNMLKYTRCLYTVTPDENFIVGQHPDHPDIIVACGFNGEGFHVSPVVGELVANCVLERTLSQLEQRMSDCFNPERYTHSIQDK